MITNLLWIQKVKTVADTAWGVFCLIGAPALVVTPFVWYLEGSHGLQSSVGSSSYHMRKGETTAIEADVRLAVTALHVQYHLELLDLNGAVVYTYPEVVTRNQPLPDFKGMLVQIPSSIGPGKYRLVAQMRYALNPIQVLTSTVHVATIAVDER